MRIVFSTTVIVACTLLTGCMVAKHTGPWAFDMFTVYDGHPSTFAERNAATHDCLNYAYNGTSATEVMPGYQICMLSLGFRAPEGELHGVAASPISGGSCFYDASMPVCWAAKNGWPLHPQPRWTKPNTSRWKLEAVASGCDSRIAQSHGPTKDAERMDKCMAAKGYTVVHPASPVVMWPPEKDWPNCAKPVDERNWIERKWCPGGSDTKRRLTPSRKES